MSGVTSLDLALGRKVVAILQDMIDKRTDAISKGGCLNWDYYKDITGELRGLRTALDVIEEAQKSLLGQDRKDQQ